ncbi:hypothetical protein MVEN_00083300 [Mycena venus]|uniref:Uncharacterized protein n=1 Tax=Mycena venus TaxID=2733690 RepID=A0A8H7DHB3_9AGAR|nr:hypothetical protein MVEN_00083300 [Mycena venus]
MPPSSTHHSCALRIQLCSQRHRPKLRPPRPPYTFYARKHNPLMVYDASRSVRRIRTFNDFATDESMGCSRCRLLSYVWWTTCIKLDSRLAASHEGFTTASYRLELVLRKALHCLYFLFFVRRELHVERHNQFSCCRVFASFTVTYSLLLPRFLMHLSSHPLSAHAARPPNHYFLASRRYGFLLPVPSSSPMFAIGMSYAFYLPIFLRFFLVPLPQECS